MKRLSGTRAKAVIVEQRGTRYEHCPDWVPAAVDRCVASGLVPRPVAVVWHPRQTSTRWGTCWPQEGRIHVYPWAGLRQEVDDELDIDVSGEISTRRIASRIVPGAQEAGDLEDTLAHELAHLVHAPHGALHTALTERLVALIRSARA